MSPAGPHAVFLLAPSGREALQRAAQAGAATLAEGAPAAQGLAAAFAALGRGPALTVSGAGNRLLAGKADDGPPLCALALDIAGGCAAAGAGAQPDAPLALSARHAPGAGLAAGDWGAGAALGGELTLWRLTPAARLGDLLALRSAPLALRELLLGARAAGLPLAMIALGAGPQFAWGFTGEEPARGFAGSAPPPVHARLDPR